MLSIFEGARVMLLQNIDTKAGLVNGRRCTVGKVIMSEDVPGQVSAIEVKFGPLNNDDEIKVPITWMRVVTFISVPKCEQNPLLPDSTQTVLRSDSSQSSGANTVKSRGVNHG
jgi:hypothetical protein